MASGIMELGYVRFGVSDLDAWRHFATRLLGLEANGDGAGALHLRADAWHHRLVLEEDARDDLLGAGLRVANAAAFRAMQEALRARNVAFEVADADQARAAHVLELMTLADPSGNPLEIFHGPLVEAHRPFHPGRPMHGRFVTGSGGIGHLMLSHGDLDATCEFYSVLGMAGGIEYRVPTPDGGEVDILFMHCNERQHTFAFCPPARKRVDHLMLEVDNLDDVLLAYELIGKSDYPLSTGLGRHSNDRNFSFYCVSPSGFRIEVGWGARPALAQSEYYVRDIHRHRNLPKPGAA